MSTVLIVQADPALHQDWCAAVEASGHTVISARGVVEGVRRVREGGIDLILVDHVNSDGELTVFVGELERLPDPPPFVLISDSPGAPEISAHLGAAAFLPKPCAVEELVHLAHRFGAIPVQPPIEDEPTEPRIERQRLLG